MSLKSQIFAWLTDHTVVEISHHSSLQREYHELKSIVICNLDKLEARIEHLYDLHFVVRHW
jgi:hypothetical protein